MNVLSTAMLAIALVFAVGVASGQGSPPAAAKPAAPSTCCPDSTAQMGEMDAHMKRMQALHEKMASAATPEERQKLMDEQRQEMQQGMAMMQQMHHGGSMMDGAGMGTMGQKGKPADQKIQLQMVEKRMDMMQAMMQMMMDQQGAMAAGPMRVPAK